MEEVWAEGMDKSKRKGREDSKEIAGGGKNNDWGEREDIGTKNKKVVQ